MTKIKLYFAVILCSLTFVSYSQQDRATIVFKDSTSVDGLAKITKSGEVKFRKKLGAKKVTYDFKDLLSVKIVDNRGLHRYYQINVKGENKPKIVELIIQGDAFLYKVTISTYMPMGNFNSNNSITSPSMKVEENEYYLRLKGEDYAYEITDLKHDKNLQTFILEKFSDCTEIHQKFKEDDIIQENILDIVNFYNSCKK